jgi:hypothetical protein
MSTLPPRKIAERKENDPSPRAGPGSGASAFRRFEALATHTVHPFADSGRSWPARPTLTTTSLAVQAVPGTRIVVYRPADEVTGVAIGKLLTGDGAGEHLPCSETHRQREAELAASLGRPGSGCR